MVVALHGLRGNSLSALLVGLLVGLLQDTLTSGPFGLFGFADTIVGYVTARLAQRLVIQRPTGVLALVSFASALQQAITVGLAFLLLPAPAPPSPVWAVVRAGGLRAPRDGRLHRGRALAQLLGGPPPRPDEQAPARLRRFFAQSVSAQTGIEAAPCRWFASIETIWSAASAC